MQMFGENVVRHALQLLRCRICLFLFRFVPILVEIHQDLTPFASRERMKELERRVVFLLLECGTDVI